MSGLVAIDWTSVLVALIAGLPAIIAAVGVILLHQAIRTPSSMSIGKQIENVLHTALANNYQLRAIGDKVKAPPAPLAHEEAKQVDQLPEGNGKEGG